MKDSVIILIAEDDDGHASLIRKNLKRAGIGNEIIRFGDGQEVLDFLFPADGSFQRTPGNAYLLLLDIRMPKVDGTEVLRRIKNDDELKKMPVIMVTTTDDPREVESCHRYGCNSYITKPVDYEKFVAAIQQLGLFLMVVQVPPLNS
jgi:CheY-like chemotaxis protein